MTADYFHVVAIPGVGEVAYAPLALPEGATLAEMVPAADLANLKPAGDAQVGWLWDAAAGDGAGAFVPPPPPPPQTSAQLADRAAAARWAKETGGITVGNAPVATDRESQALITGAWAFVQMNPSATVQFKTAAGFVAVSAAQIQSIASAVAAHVQACFAAEALVAAGIASGKVTTAAEVEAAFAAVTA